MTRKSRPPKHRTRYKILHLPTATYLFYKGDKRPHTLTLYTEHEVGENRLLCYYEDLSPFFNSEQHAEECIAYGVENNCFNFGDDYPNKNLLRYHCQIIKVL
jgi:hypothetical protein